MQRMEIDVVEKTKHLEIGQRVRLRHDRQRRGVVRARAERKNGGFRYQVALAAGESVGDISPWYVEGDLDPLAAEEPCWMSRDEFLRELLLIKLRHPLTDTLYGYRQSRTDFLEHQYLPVLKILENPDHKILIADEVGLGKTIEACYIYRELAARTPLNGVLVVCPASLRNKWQNELKEKFAEDFELLNRQQLNQLLDDYERSLYPHRFRSIVSYETIRANDFKQRISDTQFQPDLVIFDEAHHLRNPSTATHDVCKLLAAPVTPTVLLSATPLQTSDENLFHLFQLMDPKDYEEFSEFRRMAEPNRHVIQAARLLGAGEIRNALLTLRKVEQETLYETFRGNPDYHSALDELEELQVADLEQRETKQRIVRLRRNILKLNTFSRIFQRTRKREVVFKDRNGEVIEAAMRRAQSPEIVPDEREREFYEALLKDAKVDLQRRGVKHWGFARTTRERMAASCLPALRRQCLNGVAAELLVEGSVYDDLDLEESASQNGLWQDPETGHYHVKWSFSQKTRQLAEALGDQDSKFEALEQILKEILSEKPDAKLGPSKILLFASYIHTLDYLQERLRPFLTEQDVTFAVVHGGVPHQERLGILERFREEDDFRLVLSSEVSSEGIDLQFCNTIINYDMPWNPMRIEQRIGRLDRYKQLHPVIRIYNFYLDIDIDTRILKRLHERIGLFRESIGDLEPILGPVMRQLEKDLLDPNLTEAEKEEARQRAEESILSQQEIARDYEEKAQELLGSDELLRSEIDDARAQGRIIHSEEVRATLQTYLNEVCPDSSLRPVHGSMEQYILHPDVQLKTQLDEFIKRQRRTGKALPPVSEKLRDALDGNRAILITFSNETALQKSHEFITYLHPLIQLARDHGLREYRGIPALPGLQVRAKVQYEQTGFYFLFVMEETGVRLRRQLVPLIITEAGDCATEPAGHVLGQLYDDIKLTTPVNEISGWEEARRRAFLWVDELRDQREDEAQQLNDGLLRTRESAIRRTYSARIERVRSLSIRADNERIRRMYRGRIRNLEAQESESLRQLTNQRGVSISYELVATGRVRLVPQEATPGVNGAGGAETEHKPKRKEKPDIETTVKTKAKPEIFSAGEKSAATKPKPTSISQRRKRRKERKRKRRQG